MRSARLDATDWRILRELQADGRITNVDLARKVGISAPPCLRRVRALEEAGIIKGFTALLNDKALGFDVTAYAMIRLHGRPRPISSPSRAGASSQSCATFMLSARSISCWKCVA
jgi:DNA-binding Lrp family transcriptional regulator